MDISKNYPKRKRLRLQNYDYSSGGAYFVTICAAQRKPIFWQNSECRGELCSPVDNSLLPLSHIGKTVYTEIEKLNTIYPNVCVDKFCIMPDHIHLIVFIVADESGRTQFAPTLSRIIKQFKGSITKQLGVSIWQKSFIERVIRNEAGYREVWQYTDNNPRNVLE